MTTAISSRRKHRSIPSEAAGTRDGSPVRVRRICGKGQLFPSLPFDSTMLTATTADYRQRRARDMITLSRPEIGVFGIPAGHSAGCEATVMKRL